MAKSATKTASEKPAKAEPAVSPDMGIWVTKAEIAEAIAHHGGDGKGGYGAAVGAIAASLSQPKMEMVDGKPTRVQPEVRLSAKEGLQNLHDTFGEKEEGFRRLYVNKEHVAKQAEAHPHIAEALKAVEAVTGPRDVANKERSSERLKAVNEQKKAAKSEKGGAER